METSASGILQILFSIRGEHRKYVAENKHLNRQANSSKKFGSFMFAELLVRVKLYISAVFLMNLTCHVLFILTYWEIVKFRSSFYTFLSIIMVQLVNLLCCCFQMQQTRTGIRSFLNSAFSLILFLD